MASREPGMHRRLVLGGRPGLGETRLDGLDPGPGRLGRLVMGSVQAVEHAGQVSREAPAQGREPRLAACLQVIQAIGLGPLELHYLFASCGYQLCERLIARSECRFHENPPRAQSVKEWTELTLGSARLVANPPFPSADAAYEHRS